MLRIALLNAKGGCGKTTLATNLAGYYALRGRTTVLMDYDPQGSASKWLAQRVAQAPPIHGIAAHAQPGSGLTRAFQMRLPPGTERVVVDVPAGIGGARLEEQVRRAQVVLVPVLPSPIDMHSTADFIKQLFTVGQARQRGTRVAVVANRVRDNTRVYAELRRFLNSLGLPFIATLRDSQNYIRAAEAGLGIHELEPAATHRDRLQWAPLLAWLDALEEAAEPPA